MMVVARNLHQGKVVHYLLSCIVAIGSLSLISCRGDKKISGADCQRIFGETGMTAPLSSVWTGVRGESDFHGDDSVAISFCFKKSDMMHVNSMLSVSNEWKQWRVLEEDYDVTPDGSSQRFLIPKGSRLTEKMGPGDVWQIFAVSEAESTAYYMKATW